MEICFCFTDSAQLPKGWFQTPQCKPWCDAHPSHWLNKCSWLHNSCSACETCKEFKAVHSDTTCPQSNLIAAQRSLSKDQCDAACSADDSCKYFYWRSVSNRHAHIDMHLRPVPTNVQCSRTLAHSYTDANMAACTHARYTHVHTCACTCTHSCICTTH